MNGTLKYQETYFYRNVSRGTLFVLSFIFVCMDMNYINTGERKMKKVVVAVLSLGLLLPSIRETSTIGAGDSTMDISRSVKLMTLID
jgi:uncharacterized PurR-regulated membrane protein YhhQ (DUF165 family)